MAPPHPLWGLKGSASVSHEAQKTEVPSGRPQKAASPGELQRGSRDRRREEGWVLGSGPGTPRAGCRTPGAVGQPALSPAYLCLSRRYFFFSVASASAGLLCLIIILLYICIQFLIDQEELRTHPYYESTCGPSVALFPLGSLASVSLSLQPPRRSSVPSGGRQPGLPPAG